MKKHLKIKGDKVVWRYLATGPNDHGATLNYMASGGEPLRYTWSRDLAVLQLAKPLRNHHGLQFSTEEPKIGEQVEIYAYPKGVIDPFRKLQAFHGTFQGEDGRGLEVFHYLPNGDKRIRPGASGGIVVDSASGKVVGIFCALPLGNQPLAFAVPVESLANLVNKVQPFLAEELFPIKTDASADVEDFYPKFEPEQPAALQRRKGESGAIKLLREHAQALADGMRDFIAVQTFAWGNGNHHIEASDAYEVQVRDGSQKFREFPNGKKWRWTPSLPGIPAGVTPSDDWSSLPKYIGTNVGVQIREAPPAILNGRRIRVFQYYGSAEDEPCYTRDIYDFLLFSIHRDVDAIPYGEVWTDRHENIVRLSLHCEDHGWGWTDGEVIITYGWLQKSGVATRLVPVTIVYKASHRKKVYWCRGQFVDYREFITRVKILSQENIQ